MIETVHLTDEELDSLTAQLTALTESLAEDTSHIEHVGIVDYEDFRGQVLQIYGDRTETDDDIIRSFEFVLEDKSVEVSIEYKNPPGFFERFTVFLDDLTPNFINFVENFFHKTLRTIKSTCLPGGVRIFSGSGEEGTMGGVAIDPNGHPYLVTCAHVIAGCQPNLGSTSNAPVNHNDSIDLKSRSRPVIARGGAMTPFRKGAVLFADAAVAKLLAGVVPCGTVGRHRTDGEGIPTDRKRRIKNQKKIGRIIGPMIKNVTLHYRNCGYYTFKRAWRTSLKLPSGDSGSFVLDYTTNKIIGVLFYAGRRGSYFTPIKDVIAALILPGWTLK
jgi:hypothetical protein